MPLNLLLIVLKRKGYAMPPRVMWGSTGFSREAERSEGKAGAWPFLGFYSKANAGQGQSEWSWQMLGHTGYPQLSGPGMI